MIIECSQCGERKYLPEPVPYGKKYVCKSCRTVLVLPVEESAPETVETEKKNSMTLAIHQALIVLVTGFIILSLVGSSRASAKAEDRPDTPLEGIIAVLSGSPVTPVDLLYDVQEVVSQYERSIVAESVMAMRVLERVHYITPVSEPTNDMAYFPSYQYPLFPDYLNWKYSQFKYTIDENGIIYTGTSGFSDSSY